MIVRINQLPLEQVEPQAWPGGGGPLRGAIAYAWPETARAFEVLVLDRDEQQRPLPQSFRQSQVRQLIPQVAAVLRRPGEEIVVRLDGPVAPRELLPALCHLTDEKGNGRFMVSDLAKLDPRPQQVMASVRLQPSDAGLAALCADGELGLERSVRMRLFGVPAPLTNALLDLHYTSDGRWAEVLDAVAFVVHVARDLRALLVICRRVEAAEFKARLTQRLTAVAAAPASHTRSVGPSEAPVAR